MTELHRKDTEVDALISAAETLVEQLQGNVADALGRLGGTPADGAGPDA